MENLLALDFPQEDTLNIVIAAETCGMHLKFTWLSYVTSFLIISDSYFIITFAFNLKNNFPVLVESFT